MFAMALTLILGLGTCSSDGDWCVSHPAKVALDHEFVSSGKHSINAYAEHISDYSDGTFLDSKVGDRGIENIFIEYRYKIF